MLPGCFGLPSVHSFQNNACLQCSARLECARQSYKTLVSLNGTIDAKALIEQYTQVYPHLRTEQIDSTPGSPVRVSKLTLHMLTSAQIQLIKSVPVRVGECLRAIFNTGLNTDVCIATLRRGYNPFERQQFPFLFIACQKLMVDGAISRRSLWRWYVSTMQWSEATARARTSMAFVILGSKGLQLAQEVRREGEERELILVPEARPQNSIKGDLR